MTSRRKTVYGFTPVRNGESCIEETALSVLMAAARLKGEVDFVYTVLDAASTDATVNKVETLFDQWRSRCPTFKLRVISKPDLGLYDGLGRAFEETLQCDEKNPESIMFFLNAGDRLFVSALSVVQDVLSLSGVDWVTGINAAMNEKGDLVSVQIPYRFRRTLFEIGAYGRSLPYVQQESTFWKRGLLDEMDLGAFRKMRFAGDYWLWFQFSRQTTIYVVESLLGAFRIHQGQMSENRKAYWKELEGILRRPGLWDRCLKILDRMIWALPVTVKSALSGSTFLKFSHTEAKWKFHG